MHLKRRARACGCVCVCVCVCFLEGTKIQPEVFLTEVFLNPPGSWTSPPSGHGCPHRNACFPGFRGLDRSFCPRISAGISAWTSAGYPAPELTLWAAFSFLIAPCLCVCAIQNRKPCPLTLFFAFITCLDSSFGFKGIPVLLRFSSFSFSSSFFFFFFFFFFASSSSSSSSSSLFWEILEEASSLRFWWFSLPFAERAKKRRSQLRTKKERKIRIGHPLFGPIGQGGQAGHLPGWPACPGAQICSG